MNNTWTFQPARPPYLLNPFWLVGHDGVNEAGYLNHLSPLWRITRVLHFMWYRTTPVLFVLQVCRYLRLVHWQGLCPIQPCSITLSTTSVTRVHVQCLPAYMHPSTPCGFIERPLLEGVINPRCLWCRRSRVPPTVSTHEFLDRQVRVVLKEYSASTQTRRLIWNQIDVFEILNRYKKYL